MLAILVAMAVTLPVRARRVTADAAPPERKVELGSPRQNAEAVMTTIRIKRVYEAPADSDGFRLLVDRLWPRGLTREQARIDAWLKSVSPSNELRRRFHHDPAQWDDFRASYFAELEAEPSAVAELADLLRKHRVVTFLYGAKDEKFNNARALVEFVGAKKGAGVS